MNTSRCFFSRSRFWSALGAGCVGTDPTRSRVRFNGAALGAARGAIIGKQQRWAQRRRGRAHRWRRGCHRRRHDGQQASIIRNGHRLRLFRPRPAIVIAGTTVRWRSLPCRHRRRRSRRSSRLRRHPPHCGIPGYWSYDGYRYTWAAGHWENPPPNARSYVTAHWEGRGAVYVLCRATGSKSNARKIDEMSRAASPRACRRDNGGCGVVPIGGGLKPAPLFLPSRVSAALTRAARHVAFDRRYRAIDLFGQVIEMWRDPQSRPVGGTRGAADAVLLIKRRGEFRGIKIAGSKHHDCGGACGSA